MPKHSSLKIQCYQSTFLLVCNTSLWWLSFLASYAVQAGKFDDDVEMPKEKRPRTAKKFADE